MTRERGKSMEQRSFGRSRAAAAAGKLVAAAHGFPATRRNVSVRNVSRVHPGNVGLSTSASVTPNTKVIRDRPVAINR